MAEINLYQYATISMPGSERVQIGSKSTPVTITLDATSPDFYHDTMYVAQNAVVTLLTTTGKMSGLKAVIVRPTTSDMYIGWTGANSAADNSVVKVEAGALLVLTSGSTTIYNADAETRTDSGAADDIVSVYASNREAATGRVEIWAVY